MVVVCGKENPHIELVEAGALVVALVDVGAVRLLRVYHALQA